MEGGNSAKLKLIGSGSPCYKIIIHVDSLDFVSCDIGCRGNSEISVIIAEVTVSGPGDKEREIYTLKICAIPHFHDIIANHGYNPSIMACLQSIHVLLLMQSFKLYIEGFYIIENDMVFCCDNYSLAISQNFGGMLLLTVCLVNIGGNKELKVS